MQPAAWSGSFLQVAGRGIQAGAEEVVPGAHPSLGAAVLGASLMHDFA